MNRAKKFLGLFEDSKVHLGDKVIVDTEKLKNENPGYVDAVKGIIRLAYGKPTIITYQVTSNEVKISPSWEEKEGLFVPLYAISKARIPHYGGPKLGQGSPTPEHRSWISHQKLKIGAKMTLFEEK